MIPPPPPRPRFVAWRRYKGGRWQPIGAAVTRKAAWKLVYELIRTDHRSGESLVLPSGKKP
jgi:hypothetical protein